MNRKTVSAAEGPRLFDRLRGRIFPAIILAPLALWIVFLGGWPYFALCAVALSIGAVEYNRLLSGLNWRPSLPLLLSGVLLQLLGAQLASAMISNLALLAALFATVIVALVTYERQPERPALAEWLAAMGGILLLGWVGGHLLRLRQLPDTGAEWTLVVIVSIWLADSGAFIVGGSFGRRRLAPRLSPKKSVEGFIGGILLGAPLTALLAAFLQLPWMVALMLGALIAILGPAGDLAISLIKRESGIKQSGALFGEHGGALDRLDSVIWSAAIAFYFLSYALPV